MEWKEVIHEAKKKKRKMNANSSNYWELRTSTDDGCADMHRYKSLFPPCISCCRVHWRHFFFKSRLRSHRPPSIHIIAVVVGFDVRTQISRQPGQSMMTIVCDECECVCVCALLLIDIMANSFMRINLKCLNARRCGDGGGGQ